MSDVTGIAASGLRAASLWLEAAASNIANMQDTGPVADPGHVLAAGAGQVYQGTRSQYNQAVEAYRKFAVDENKPEDS